VLAARSAHEFFASCQPISVAPAWFMTSMSAPSFISSAAIRSRGVGVEPGSSGCHDLP
jgi:hypothetical protein